MKAAILHGTGSDSTGNWFPWLKTELEKLGFEVWIPDLPEAELPSIERYNKFLLSKGWDFNDNLIIGHSSGSVAILGLLAALPAETKINTAILVGTFHGDLGREDLKGVDMPFEYEKLKSKSKKFIVVHSDNDTKCPLEGAKWIAGRLDADFELLPGMGHFSQGEDSRFDKFPELLDIIRQQVPAR